MKSKPGLIAPSDYGFMEENPYGDPNFNADHNKKVVADSIKKYEANRRRKQREHREDIRYRSEAVAKYFESIKQGNGGDIKKYFGKEELLRLRGQEILNHLKMNPAIVKKLKKRLSNVRGATYQPL